ncbi:phage portal protein [Arthrobacter sp. 24S4-2]|uniref:phage portal protein n=1 Tax=Arthrobacter sp. 24S4-2 TaxID=2575374 RepID=UPI0010C7BECE|nr:phage portal protein [Arthrobacter sp. 24S4-2]QCO98965.1 phage portal protein [Arthrobacter sp. 24S4-2]
MGLFSKAKQIAEYNPATGFPQSTQVTGLFSPSTLALALFPDTDTSAFPVDAATALTVPAVNRGIQIYSSLGSRLNLLATNTITGEAVELPWLTHTDGAITPAKRQAGILQDLIFYNEALLSVARDDAGYVADFRHVPHSYWTKDGQGNIVVQGKKVSASDYVFVPSLMPLGFLEVARDSIRQYRNITQTINNRTAIPEPVVLIKETQVIEASQAEIDDMLLQLDDSLTQGRGGKVYVPYGLDVSGFGATDSANALMIEGRESLRKDLANHLGITVGLLDGTNGDSNTYNNAVDERNELLELSLKTWTEPLADSLSQDSCTPPGIKISVDYSSFNSHVSAKGNTVTPLPEGIPNV